MAQFSVKTMPHCARTTLDTARTTHDSVRMVQDAEARVQGLRFENDGCWLRVDVFRYDDKSLECNVQGLRIRVRGWEVGLRVWG